MSEETKAPKIKLIAMTKNGETLEVNQACVEAHEAAGWKIAE